MEHKKNSKTVIGSLVICLALAVMPAAGFGWEAGTHAYIEEHLYKKQGQTDPIALYNRIYGANAIDIFNNNFTSPYVEFQAYIHDTTRDNFMKTWDAAESRDQKSFAYGFAGHNNTWGMDSTAHTSGITFGRGQGYVIAKASILAANLKPALESQLGPLPDEVILNICHYLAESGVDFLVRSLDPSIGNKLMAAAYYRSDEISALLAKAYASDLSAIAGTPENAATIIVTAEGTFRASLMGYGWALTQDNALDLVAAGLAKTGASYLHLPAGSAEVLVPIARQGILAAMDLCATDFKGEISATTGWVNGNLSSNGIMW